MPITPVPPAQRHSSPKEGFTFCCSFIPLAFFIHLALLQVQLHFVFYASLGAMLQNGHNTRGGTILQQVMPI